MNDPQREPVAGPNGDEALLYQDDFSGGLANWIVEQRPGGTVQARDGTLQIRDAEGGTVWFRHELRAPVEISYTVIVSSSGRVSDMNCFWMATDPRSPGDLFTPGHSRDGSFGTYDNLRTYYAGYGGNHNSTTRFRRYSGHGDRPLLPEHDLRDPEFLLTPDHPYEIRIIVQRDETLFIRDGEVVFRYPDDDPLTRGWFGFRTVWSHLEIRDFKVRRLDPIGPASQQG